jgi:8-oxo-dGTP pyrophosphatase MutT (NUDIX family)
LSKEFAGIKDVLSTRTPRRVEKPGVMETAVALILAPGARGLEALFIRRAEREGDPWSGHIALPGGRRDPGDADRLATAVRETAEEVGVALNASCLLGALDDLHPSTPRLPALVISPYAFGLPARPATRLSDEVSGVIWLPLSELRACAGKAVIRVQGADREVDCFRTDDLVIWGLTYRIVTGFLPLLG